MTKSQIERAALQLSPEERLELADRLVESVGETAPVPTWHLQLVREGVAAYRANADDTVSWEDVAKEIWPRYDLR